MGLNGTTHAAEACAYTQLSSCAFKRGERLCGQFDGLALTTRRSRPMRAR
jgi:hypothetical protein